VNPEERSARTDQAVIKVPRRLDRLVEAGRITADEARRLQAGDTDAATEVRVRHATALVEGAVAAGRVSREEADRLLVRLRAGEHSPELRRELNLLLRN
jgi:polyhydroxyalkanoate synthesis regulator phasin